MRLGFAGTPDFAAIILRELTRTPHDVVRILTQPARPSGRGRKIISSAVQQEADRCSMFYVVERWLGGTLTNFATIKRSIRRLASLEKESSPIYQNTY